MNDVKVPTYEIFETMGKILEALGDSFSQKLAERIGGMLPNFEAQGKKTEYQLQDIRKQIEIFATNGDLLENANRTNQLLGSEFYDQRVIQPMLRGLFPLWDLICEINLKAESTRPDDELFSLSSAALRVQLEQFLNHYDVEVFEHEPNSRFDPKLMKPLQTTPTTDGSLVGLVAESLQFGFKIRERILRLETVSLFSISEAEASETPDSIEGESK